MTSTPPASTQPASSGPALRRLQREDIAAVAGIDASITGRSRRAYLERRRDAAQREPSRHVQIAVDEDGCLAGYVLARELEGEFGRRERALTLETIGVAPSSQARGLGTRLLQALESEAARRGIAELRTQSAWRDHGMLRFLDRSGFELARTHVIDCEVRTGSRRAGENEAARAPEDAAAGEINYGAPAAGGFGMLSRDRIEVRSLMPGDVDAVARIDRHLFGRHRGDYIARRVEEALYDSAIRVSLAACLDGGVAGYLTAKADFGDFGRTEPVAVLDTVGVDPDFAGKGVGTALLSQLLVNLEALRIERVETVVAYEHADLLGFFYRVGFAPSERLAFVKRLANG